MPERKGSTRRITTPRAGRKESARCKALRAAPAVARFDVALTVCTMRYVSDLRIGRINPAHFKFGLSVEQKKYDLAQFLRDQIMTTSNLQAVSWTEWNLRLPAIAGPSRRLPATSNLHAPTTGKSFPKSRSPSTRGRPMPACRVWTRLLRLVGDLPADAALTGDAQIYGGPLVDAVKRFQRRHGLDDDGRLGPGTIKQLNVPLQRPSTPIAAHVGALALVAGGVFRTADHREYSRFPAARPR